MEINYRFFSEADVEGIFNVSSLSFKTPWTFESIKNEINNPFAKYIVAFNESEILGFIGGWIIASEGDIVNVAVHPNYRKFGIGSTLLKNFIDLGLQENWVKLNLEVRESNIAAQNLYKKFNFKLDGIRKEYYEDNKENAILMSYDFKV